MASPPGSSYSPSALSPPYPSHSQLPPLNTLNMPMKKRASADGTPAPSLKRRKTSTMSAASAGSAHPLRQTSFPPDEMGTPLTARSPSVDLDSASIVSGSQASGAAVAAASARKKRGRKPKAEKIREQTPSVAGGRAPTAVSGTSGGRGGGGPKSNAGGAGEAAGDGDDDENDDPDTEMINTQRSEHDRQEEKRLRAALTTCMDIDQFERISAWRAVKLPDAVIRRLVNATVSQSVPASVVTAVRSITKYFLTEIIAKAQKVQDEWIAATGEKQADSEWPGKVLSRDGPEVRELYEKQAKMSGAAIQSDWSEHILKQPPKGPLRPDHIREAWRRYQASMQGYGAGSLALWYSQQQNGAERFPVRTGGKIIFR